MSGPIPEAIRRETARKAVRDAAESYPIATERPPHWHPMDPWDPAANTYAAIEDHFPVEALFTETEREQLRAAIASRVARLRGADV